MSSSTSESASVPRPRSGLKPSAEQLQLLSSWVASADPRLQKRARIILLASEGKSAEIIGRELQLAIPTVYKWCRRFDKRGPQGLSDLPRSGQPHRLPKTLRQEIVRITTEEKPPRGSRWTIRLAARHLGVTQHQIRKVWSDAGLRPHDVAQASDDGNGNSTSEGDQGRSKSAHGRASDEANGSAHASQPLLGLQSTRARAQAHETSSSQV